MRGSRHWPGPQWPDSPHANVDPRDGGLCALDERCPADPGPRSSPRIWTMCPPRGGMPREEHARCPYVRGRRKERQHLPCAPGRQAGERDPLWPNASRPAGWHPPRYIGRIWARRFVEGNPAQGGRKGTGRTGPRRRSPIGTGPMPCEPPSDCNSLASSPGAHCKRVKRLWHIGISKPDMWTPSITSSLHPTRGLHHRYFGP